MVFSDWSPIVTTVLLSYLAMYVLYNIILISMGLWENEKRNEEDEFEDYSTIGGSAFPLHVTVIIPVRNEEHWIAESLKAILRLEYPGIEIIVVDDGSSDRTIEILDGMLQLKAVDQVFMDHFNAGKAREIYRSERYPDVLVVSKFPGHKKAGALNMALNFARHRYVCAVDADTLLEPEAFLKMMAHVGKDPDHIIGVGCYFGLINGFKIKDGRILEKSFSPNPIVASQNLEYIRTFIGNRTAWSKYNAVPTVGGGFGIWRKDILQELGGFSPDFSCEDIELTFRVHRYISDHPEKKFKIVLLPYCAAWTEGPNNIAALLLQRSRWQRVTLETVTHYWRMLFKPTHKAFTFLTYPYMIFYEAFGIFFELAAIVFALWGWCAGLLDARAFLAFFLMMMGVQTFISLLALLNFVSVQKAFKAKDIFYLVVLSFLEFFWYRWLLTLSKIMGTLSFFKRVRAFDQYQRSKTA